MNSGYIIAMLNDLQMSAHLAKISTTYAYELHFCDTISQISYKSIPAAIIIDLNTTSEDDLHEIVASKQNHNITLMGYCQELNGPLLNYFKEDANPKNIEKDLWIEKIEEKLVNEGIKIFLERIKFSNDFNSLSNNFKNFPRIKIFLTGKIEKLLSSKNLETVKKIYLQKLLNCRKIDSIKGSISYGPNKSDLKVMFLKKKKLMLILFH